MFEISIPIINRDELWRRYAYIKPIVEIEGKKCFLREFTTYFELSNTYILDLDKNKGEPVDITRFDVLRDLLCLHNYDQDVGMFLPTIEDVLAQIPEVDEPWVDAFEIIESYTESSDIVMSQVMRENDICFSKVRLYTKGTPRIYFED